MDLETTSQEAAKMDAANVSITKSGARYSS
jgi:hypothetical protein